MLSPDEFRVNEAWIAIRINEQFLFVEDEPYDMYVLMDAASTYVFGHVLSKAPDEAPPRKDVDDLFNKAWEAKNQWAEKLIVAANSDAAGIFKEQAEDNGLSVMVVPLSDLGPIISPVKELFASTFTASAP